MVGTTAPARRPLRHPAPAAGWEEGSALARERHRGGRPGTAAGALAVLIVCLAAGAGVVAAAPPAIEQLAPGAGELLNHLREARERVGAAEVVGRAVTLLHNRWAERIAVIGKSSPCADPLAASLARRASAFGQGWRDATQSARSQVDRLERIARAPTVEALMADAERRAVLDLRARVDAQVTWYAEAAAWHRQFVSPASAPCVREVAAAPGVAEPISVGRPVEAQGVAVIGLGGGLLCPGWQAADGRVVVVRGGQACYGVADCSCEPARVLPGAVLAP